MTNPTSQITQKETEMTGSEIVSRQRQFEKLISATNAGFDNFFQAELHAIFQAIQYDRSQP